MARKAKAKRKNEKWIQEAIKEEGSLRALAKKEGALTRSGTIKVSWLKEKAKQGNTKVARRARLALTLRKLSRKR